MATDPDATSALPEIDLATADDRRLGEGADTAMTRSEERLRVDTQTVETGRVRLRKHIVTEMQTIQVPVSREEISVEHVQSSATDQPAGADAQALTEEDYEVVLHTQRPVVTMETVAVERAVLRKRIVQENISIVEQVRREEIDVNNGGVTDVDVDPGVGR